MTDSDIIKALECCTSKGECAKCPLYTPTSARCVNVVIEMALDRVKRQQAEIERLKAEKDNLIRTYKECAMEAVRDFAERLKARETYFEYRLDDGEEVVFKAVEREVIDMTVKEMGIDA